MKTTKSDKSILSETPVRVIPLSGAGSGRRYYRYIHLGEGESSVQTQIMTESENIEENRLFVALSRFFKTSGVNVPEIYNIDDSGTTYCQQDLGDTSLLDMIRKGDEKVIREFVRKTIDQLVKMQTVDISRLKSLLKDQNLRLTPSFDRQSIMWDLNYFKYEFVKPSGVIFDEWALEDDFILLSDRLAAYQERMTGFMMRDCQSRNVMIHDNDAYLIDFQGGRVGPLIYDIISLLWQARAGFSDAMRQEMLTYYVSRLSENAGLSAEEILSGYEEWVLLRLLQVLGAYGLRGLVERKAQFVESIPSAVCSVAAVLAGNLGEKYPALKGVMDEIAKLDRFKAPESDGRLCVQVFSFSYKKGYPEDLSGNGGGFMFDCRAMHNPGRYDEYKQKTGLDEEVKRFLEDRGEVQEFIGNAEALVFPAVERYLQRGFTSLQIGFGCTGGQHRSVYCAQAVAEDIAAKFPKAKVILTHREQGIQSYL